MSFNNSSSYTIPSSFTNGVFTLSSTISSSPITGSVTIPASYSGSQFTPSFSITPSFIDGSITIPASYNSDGTFNPSRVIYKNPF